MRRDYTTNVDMIIAVDYSHTYKGGTECVEIIQSMLTLA